MVVTSIRQAGGLKPQVRVRELRVGQAEMPLWSEQWSIRVGPLYIRGANPLDLRWAPAVEMPARSIPLATLLEVSSPDLKIIPHTLCKVRPGHPQAPLTPQFFGFSPLFLKIFKNFFAPRARHCPPCAESPRRTRSPPKNPGIPRQNRPFALRYRPEIARKTLPQNPKKPAPHTPPRKKVE